MNENFRSSLWKWNAGLWKRLTNQLTVLRKHIPCGEGIRRDAWMELLWNECGFCKEFLGCETCPLNRDSHCHRGYISTKEHLFGMRQAWIKNDRDKFEELREDFYNILKTYKNDFKAEKE